MSVAPLGAVSCAVGVRWVPAREAGRSGRAQGPAPPLSIPWLSPLGSSGPCPGGSGPGTCRLVLSASFFPTLNLCSVRSRNEHSSPPPLASAPMASEQLIRAGSAATHREESTSCQGFHAEKWQRPRWPVVSWSVCAVWSARRSQPEALPVAPECCPRRGVGSQPRGEPRKPVPGPCSLVLVDFVCHASKAKQTVGPCCHFPAPGMRGRLCSVVGYNWFCCGEPPLSTHPKSQWFTARAVYTSAALQSEWEPALTALSRPRAQAAPLCMRRCAGEAGRDPV